MAKTWADKDPDEVLDYGFDWSPRGLGTDIITTTSAAVITGSVAVAQHGVAALDGVPTGQGTVTWLTGGTAGETCELLLKAITQVGRKLDQTMTIQIKQR